MTTFWGGSNLGGKQAGSRGETRAGRHRLLPSIDPWGGISDQWGGGAETGGDHYLLAPS